MAKETPLQAVKRLYGSKDKLIDKLVEVARGPDEDAGEVKERLATVSNQKLLRMAEVGKRVKDKYGSRDKLVDSLCKSLGKSKDKDYQASLSNLSTARLLDLMRAADPGPAATTPPGASTPAFPRRRRRAYLVSVRSKRTAPLAS
jgi:hypothetical protein